MQRFFTPPRVLVLLALLLFASALSPVSWSAWLGRPLRAALVTVTTPFADPIKSIADRPRRPAEKPMDDRDPEALRRAYQRLLRYSRNLEQRLRDARARAQQLGRVQRHVDMSAVELIPVTVTDWASGRGTWTLTINRGKRGGVRRGQAVVRGAALVGRVTDVDPVTATVRLVTAPEQHIVSRMVPPVVGEPSREVAPVRLKTEAEKQRLWAKVGADRPVREGDLAHLADDTWPRAAQGFVIGKVVSVEKWPDDPLMYRRVTVKPTGSLPHLRRAVVVSTK